MSSFIKNNKKSYPFCKKTQYTHYMSIDLNVASCSTGNSGCGAEVLESSLDVHRILERLVGASAKIPGLTTVSPENLEVIEHLGKGRDLIVSGPDRLASITCAALPAAAGYGLVLVVAHSISSIRRMKDRFGSLSIVVESFDLAPTKVEKRAIWDRMDRSEVQILLVTPGRLSSSRFRERLRRRDIGIIIIDQAQFMSPWSHKFLPNYRVVGNFLASLQAHIRQPQKIAIVWNPNARINHDLTHLLQLQDPYQGRLVSETVSGHAIESVSAANESDRIKVIEHEIQRSTGQGVIYCNSIKQMFDTTELLKRYGEDFEVVRPGIDEPVASSIRQKFESGRVRIVVSIGPFLSEMDRCDALDFVIFNGLTDSAETLAREIFGLEDTGLIRTIIISGEKDYFHHRFSIDKNYPDTLLMRACFQGVRDVFGSKQSVTLETLNAHIRMATPYPDEDVYQCLQVMFREGLLEKVIDQETGTQIVKFSALATDEASFWHEYPLRKIDHVSRLDRMRDLALKSGDHERLLRSLIKS
jgi:hypothetical protein